MSIRAKRASASDSWIQVGITLILIFDIDQSYELLDRAPTVQGQHLLSISANKADLPKHHPINALHQEIVDHISFLLLPHPSRSVTTQTHLLPYYKILNSIAEYSYFQRLSRLACGGTGDPRIIRSDWSFQRKTAGIVRSFQITSQVSQLFFASARVYWVYLWKKSGGFKVLQVSIGSHTHLWNRFWGVSRNLCSLLEFIQSCPLHSIGLPPFPRI